MSDRRGDGDKGTGEREEGGPLQNLVLAALPPEVFDRVAPHLESVRGTVRQVVIRPEEPIKVIAFPTTGVYSLVSPLQSGPKVEVATVGYEGFLGVPVLLGADSTPLLGFCQVEGGALHMPVPAFRRLVDELPPSA